MSSKWIWPFELMDKLGEGGMGVVYRARYVGNNRIVAVKLLPPDVLENENLSARFDRELEILKQLKHPHIVTCFGGVCESQQRFYAMELVEGGTLAELLRKKRRFTWDHVVEYGLQMCAGLQHAHEQGVVHRDIKPANFLISKTGKLKLSDFGLATMQAASKITKAGKTAGTFQYMAPEQIRGQPPVTNRTDLYALGCVLYELLTGQPLFEAEAPAALLHKHLKEAPPRASSLIPDCPPALDHLINELLAKHPDDRPESAAAVAQRLEAIVRPSLRGLDPMARTIAATPAFGSGGTAAATASRVSQQLAKLDDEDAEVHDDPRRGQRWLPWLIAGNVVAAVLTLLAIASAVGWSQRAHRLQSAWIEIANTAEEPLRAVLLEHLATIGPFSPEIEALMEQTLAAPEDRLRIAALKAFALQASTSGDRIGEILKIQKHDPSDLVRHQAGITAQALRDAPEPPNRLIFWLGLLAMLGLLGGSVAMWCTRHRWRPYLSTGRTTTTIETTASR